MNLLALDTATAATVVGLAVSGRLVAESRDDPEPGERPRHNSRLLALVDACLREAQADWNDIDRIAVGVGPGSFTGLRIGLATARGLAQGTRAEVAAVSTLQALAVATRAHAGGGPVCAVIDARRGEVFSAAWSADGEPLIPASARAPSDLGVLLQRLEAGTTVVGDGAVRYADVLEEHGAAVPEPASGLHRVGAGALCELGSRAAVVARDELVPDYLREPDATPPRLP